MKEYPRKMIILDTKRISDSIYISEENARKGFSDGRVVSRFAEEWSGILYGITLSNNTNKPGSDGDIQTGNILLGNVPVGVRSLSENGGIKFQQSKYIGSGRTCTIENLIDSINTIDYEIVVDIADSPRIKFIPIDRTVLLKMISDGVLTPSGFTRKKFYTVLFGRQLTDDEFELIQIYG